jgi:hypothetical protein
MSCAHRLLRTASGKEKHLAMGPHDPMERLGTVRQSVSGPHGGEIHDTVRARLKDIEAWAPRHGEQASGRAKES